MKIGIRPLVAGAVALFFSVGASQAATVIIEDFGTVKPDDPYNSQGFVYTPVGATHGQCFEAWCLKEAGTQELLTTVEAVPEGLFDLLGFYINLDGNGSTDDNGSENFLEIIGKVADSTVKLLLGLNVDYSADPRVSLYTVEDSPVAASELEKKSDGFWVIIEDDYFDNLSALSFNALGSANVRIDCVALSKDGGNLGGVSGITGCVGSDIPQIPLPASLPLLLGGIAVLGGVSSMRRRKHS